MYYKSNGPIMLWVRKFSRPELVKEILGPDLKRVVLRKWSQPFATIIHDFLWYLFSHQKFEYSYSISEKSYLSICKSPLGSMLCHKLNVRLKPTLNLIRSSTYAIAKYLGKISRQFTGKTWILIVLSI